MRPLTPRPAHGASGTDKDSRWAAVVARDRDADGTFYYSVKTTGVYCRPSCGARLANPANVQFHLTAADAERAGFRACKRCKPTEPPLERRHAATIAKVCREIETAESMPSLASRASRAGLSTYHFHRIFKAVTGLTPREYAAAHRAAERQNLLPGRAVHGVQQGAARTLAVGAARSAMTVGR